VLALSFPRKSWWMRIGLAAANSMLRITRREFHIFMHPPKRILATCEQHGLKATFNRTGLIWTVATLRRAT
jgi:hypothetical protein